MSMPIVARTYRSVSYFAARTRARLQGSRFRTRGVAPAPRERGPIAGPLNPVLTELWSEGCTIMRRPSLFTLLSHENRTVLETTIKACSGDGARVETIPTSEELFAQNPDLYLLGLDGALLDAAEDYLGAQPMYLGAFLKREAVDTKVTGTRNWHRDVEDGGMFRIIVYLSDVGGDTGPFEYLPAPQSEASARTHGYRGGYLDDERAAVLVPSEHRLKATGAAGDAVVFDGIRIFHRAGLPVSQDRLSLTLTYLCRQSQRLHPSARLTRAAVADLKKRLTARQYASLPKPFLL